ncbi:MAG: hypothetical protein WC749_11165 [Dehalococcoidia bacterium]
MPVPAWRELIPKRKEVITWQAPEYEVYPVSRYMSTWPYVGK